MSMFAYFGVGLFVNELNRLQQVAVEQSRLRQEAEEQLRALVESSPAAILTLDSDGKVQLANEAAHRILGVSGGELAGQSVEPYLPVLTAVPRIKVRKGFFRSTIECTGRKQNGEIFLAQVWFSTYQTISGPRLAAIISDGSDELRAREGGGLHSVMNMSQILVRAAMHEIRNLAAAAAVAHANLERLPGARGSEDFKALGTLVSGLEKIASSELRPASEQAVGNVHLKTLFDELRIVIEPSFREAGIEMLWKISAGLPPVRADHQGLLQVFLNLAQNARRAMRNVPIKKFTVSACIEDDWLRVRFHDTGHGVPVPDRLFQPLQPGAEATGLGLYVSRAIVRSFAGDLRHEQQSLGTCFTVELELARTAVAAAIA
jgi:PAS domain S-box-containing protein